MNRDQLVLIKGLLEKEFAAFKQLSDTPKSSRLYDERKADYYQWKADEVKETYTKLLEEFGHLLHTMSEPVDKKDQPIWGVTIDGERVNTPLRTYREARNQAHQIAKKSDSWFGIEVISSPTDEAA